ncbi:hypothetical protein [Microbacterium amylolyticum]|uniref:Uncharacterized protein n=1 Tax=Microbacterium amylolyticum TaxID=936337 RepID=A0ABS4ZHU8_9MICO|nr:hypothetical protein [Microbacterium amylolyticum]MBP2436855.1 hypothetical protein [Microbacterium amylolyticum]
MCLIAPLFAAWLLTIAPALGFDDAYTGMYVLLAIPVAAVAGVLPLLPPLTHPLTSSRQKL